MKAKIHSINFLSIVMSLWAIQVSADVKIGSITIPSTNMTQSEAHLSVPAIRNTVERWYNVSTTPYFQNLFNEADGKERQYNNTHYVFYNAFINEWRVPQDLYSKLYVKFHPDEARLKDFHALRWMPTPHINPQDFLKKRVFRKRIG